MAQLVRVLEFILRIHTVEEPALALSSDLCVWTMAHACLLIIYIGTEQ